jgi:lysozyme
VAKDAEMNVYDQIMRDEGLRLQAYQDSRGVWTIGYGTNLQVLVIDEPTARAWMTREVERIRQVFEIRLPWAKTLDEPRAAALLNLAYNVGVIGLLKFRRMLETLQGGDYAQAAAEIRSSLYATQVGPRAQRIARQIQEGVWV